MTATAADALRMLAPDSPDTWTAGILAAADMREARAEAATLGRWVVDPHPLSQERECYDLVAGDEWIAHVDSGPVRHWRSVAERHVCDPIWSRGCQDCRNVWPCDDLVEVADEARTYLGGSP